VPGRLFDLDRRRIARVYRAMPSIGVSLYLCVGHLKQSSEGVKTEVYNWKSVASNTECRTTTPTTTLKTTTTSLLGEREENAG
jgi:hypothetical protein